MNVLNKLTELFSEFPGIGGRQARRFVYFLLTKNSGYIDELTLLIADIKKEVSTCKSCFRFFPRESVATDKCKICRDKNRDNSLLAIVSYDVDMENIEKTGSFKGNYFVLGGSVPILEDAPEKRIRLKELLKTVEERARGGLTEIILAMNFNSLGENTADFVKRALSPFLDKYPLKITTLGKGLSLGTELEYSDNETIKNALRNRQ